MEAEGGGLKAFGFKAHGGPEAATVLEVPEPFPGPGEVKISVRAAGLNHLDLFTLQGIPGVEVPLPHVLAGDGSGVIVEVGEGVGGLRKGDRVLVDPSLPDGTCEYCLRGLECFCRNYRILGEHTQGVASEFAVLPAGNVRPLPSTLGFESGGCAALVFMTAYRALYTVGELRANDQVAIMGAGGGLSTAAVQLAHVRGARVVVVTSDEAKGARARELGADEVVLRPRGSPGDRELWKASGKRGFDVIFDSTGEATFAGSARALARGGRLVFCGATTGPTVTVDLRPLFWRGASLRGSTMATRQEFAEVLSLLRSGAVRPVVDAVLPLEGGPEALTRLARGEVFGKLVLRPS
jgi:NADPH:quinone reductase-like Zn-dependent oxidoreductase